MLKPPCLCTEAGARRRRRRARLECARGILPRACAAGASRPGRDDRAIVSWSAAGKRVGKRNVVERTGTVSHGQPRRRDDGRGNVGLRLLARGWYVAAESEQ